MGLGRILYCRRKNKYYMQLGTAGNKPFQIFVNCQARLGFSSVDFSLEKHIHCVVDRVALPV